MALLDDVITYLEMHIRPTAPPVPAPLGKLALMRAEDCTVSFYRYLYETVGTPWLWYERRLLDDAALAAQIGKPTTEIFVLYVGGVPAGLFRARRRVAAPDRAVLFRPVPEFIGRRLGPFLLRAAIDQAWSRPIGRLWVHTRTFDHPQGARALPARRVCRLRPPAIAVRRPADPRHPAALVEAPAAAAARRAVICLVLIESGGFSGSWQRCVNQRE